MSEKDPWKRLVALVAHLTPNTEDGARRSMAVLDAMEAQFAARAAEATQRQQEIAAKDAIIKQQAADLKVGGEMQDRETALKEALRRTISLMEHYWPRPNDEQAEAMNRAYRVLASPLSISPQEPTGASPHAEELRAANVANLREMVGMAGRHRETLLAVRECILALSPGHRTGYDWNADPLFLTLKEGRALNLIDDALKATPASPQAEMTQCDYCHTWRSRPCGEGCCWQPAPVSPVEPTPEPPVGSEAWRQGSSVRPIMTASSNTPAAPETCEWRESESGLYADSGCRQSEFFEVVSVEEWKVCPYCLKPLRLVPSEETK